MEKCLAAVGVFSVLHIVIDQHITAVLLQYALSSFVVSRRVCSQHSLHVVLEPR